MTSQSPLNFAPNFASKDLATAEALDAAGWLIGENEAAEDFFGRVQKAKIAFIELRLSLLRGEKISWDEIVVSQADLIAPSALVELTSAARNRYKFSLDEAAGFVLSQRWGTFWGGAAFYDPDRDARFFLLRSEFRDHEKLWGMYSRDELLAHEICHIARQPLADDVFDEFFAYQTGHSRLRRYLGNCFIYPSDAWFLLIPCFAIFASAVANFFFPLPQMPFFIGFIIGVGYLLARNYRSRKTVFRAQKNLRLAGVVETNAVLFRASATEIYDLAQCDSPSETREYIASRIADNFRWRVINRRFINSPFPPADGLEFWC